MIKQGHTLRLDVVNRDIGLLMIGAAVGILLLGLITVVCVVVTRAPVSAVLFIAAPAIVSGLLAGGWIGLRSA